MVDRIWNTLKPKKVLWINFSVLFAVYAICIFSHHASPDYYCSMMYGNADINLQNGRFLNWFLYYTADLLGIEMEKNSVFSQFVWTVSCAVSSYWVYSAFIKEVEDTSINRLMIQLASLIMFINISLWEGWYSFPETVLFATVNLLACYGAVALFAKERTAMIDWLKEQGVYAVFHYVPLHSAPAGLRYGRFAGIDRYTTSESDRLVRLPMYYNLSPEDAQKVIDSVLRFFRGREC